MNDITAKFVTGGISTHGDNACGGGSNACSLPGTSTK